MFTKPAIFSINLYQKHISPRKGFCCAYAAYHDGLSCSAYAKQVIMENGVSKAIPLIKERFKECKQASEYIQNEYKDIKEDEKVKPGKCEQGGQCGLDACSAGSCLGILAN